MHDHANEQVNAKVSSTSISVTYVNSTDVETDLYPHMPILCPHAARVSSVTFTSAHLCGTINRTSLWL